MIIVTGGAGFIGSNLVRGLNHRGITDILVVDDLEFGDKHRNLNSLEFTDYIDRRDLLERLPELGPVDTIFHQGACSDTMESDGRFMLEVNYEFSKSLLDYCLSAGTRFVYASSASVYGNGDDGFRESSECEYPLNVYAYSKFLFDRWVRRVLPEAKSQIVGLRYFNVYGPQENHKGRMASVIYHFHRQIQDGGAMRLFEGSEDFRRDFIYVNDVVDVNLFFLDNPDKSGIFNCGTGEAQSFLNLANAVQSCFEGSQIERIPFPAALEGKYQAFTQADMTALRSTGYQAAFTSLEDGVAAYTDVLSTSNGFLRGPA
ncbi:MAG: ADP-L-glycero-D-manno-heptose 6-epimerase [Planctomycetota bacterium]|jgi:ADP-L-glycero-D-manno-heptose 6-epimerase